MFAARKTDNVSSAANYIEECFSVYLYTGNGSTQTITNGIDLSTKGGLVWTKSRSNATSSELRDTLRGVTKSLRPDSTAAEATDTGNALTAFNSDGFSLGADTWFTTTNVNGRTYASWTFRKQAKFFDVVTYTGTGPGTGANEQQVSHNLGSKPGAIIIKRTDSTGDWWFFTDVIDGSNDFGYLNTTDAFGNSGNNVPTSTVFNVGGVLNTSGATYVAYLFAHDAGGFGTAGSDNVISCGSYTGTSGVDTVTLGYEPQWLLIKRSSGTGPWWLVDNMRGMSWGSDTIALSANTSGAENTDAFPNIRVRPTSTGFQLPSDGSEWDGSGSTYIYIAIRRGPMKTPTSGTSVFSPVARTGTSAAATMTAGFAPDAVFLSNRNRSATNYNPFYDKLRGNNAILSSNNTGAEQDLSGSITQYTNTGITLGSDAFGNINASGGTYINWIFQRAPGFFDVVCYTGTGSNTTFTHNLGVVPEMMIVKRRSAANAWAVYANNDNTDYLVLNTDAATVDDNTYWNDTSPTSSVFSVGTNNAVNASGSTYVAYLFASVTGVSKVGSYTGNGSNQTINCGFTAGARFVMIKRTDSTGDWYVYDTARGIVSGNDPQLKLNSTAAEATGYDAIDPDNSGFIVNNDATNFPINVNNATYIYLAIA